MAASNLFGRGIGTRKLKLIFDVEPELLVDTNRQNIETLTKINGIGKENAKIVLQNIPRFMAFLKECNLESKLYGEKNPPNDNMSKKLENIVIGEPLAENDPLFGKHIVMTKTRDTTVIDGLKRRGAIITDNVKTNTFAVIVKSYEDESNKTKKAKELGIPILIPADFIAQYF
jgi:NAD-dependent DNA ligase